MHRNVPRKCENVIVRAVFDLPALNNNFGQKRGYCPHPAAIHMLYENRSILKYY
jgi:hypothetical protein